jgi:ABC-type multidrug transport system fused ATPase/permease subunit
MPAKVIGRIIAACPSLLANNFLGLIAILFFALLMASYDVGLALVVIIVALLNLVALRYVSRRRRDLNLRMIQESGKLMGTSMDGLTRPWMTCSLMVRLKRSATPLVCGCSNKGETGVNTPVFHLVLKMI